MSRLLEHLRQRLLAQLGLGEEGERALLLSPPKNRSHGDVALGCFALAKARKLAPPQLAQEVASAFDPDEMVESAAAAGPFVNFRFNRGALAREVVVGVLEGEAPYGPAGATGETIVIDFSSPNIA